MSIYWATSAVFGLGQHLLFMYPPVRHKVGIPAVPSDNPKPMRALGGAFKQGVMDWRADERRYREDDDTP